MSYEVRDGSRRIVFDGKLLARSSSQRPGRARWVEFELYRTTSGSYVLGRQGVSSVYHTASCQVALQNDLRPVRDPVPVAATPCEVCVPTRSLTETCQERPRYWAQVSSSAESVVDALYRVDESGTYFLTAVARRLLDDASRVDDAIKNAYQVERVL